MGGAQRTVALLLSILMISTNFSQSQFWGSAGSFGVVMASNHEGEKDKEKEKEEVDTFKKDVHGDAITQEHKIVGGMTFQWNTTMWSRKRDQNTGEFVDPQPYLNGFITIDQSGMKEMKPWPKDGSFRICVQIFQDEEEPKVDIDGKPIAGASGKLDLPDGYGQKDSYRSRFRFFNKKLSEFTFYPQVGLNQKQSRGKSVNPDWMRVGRKESDNIQNWCDVPFTGDGVPDSRQYVLNIDEVQVDNAVSERMKVPQDVDAETKEAITQSRARMSLEDQNLLRLREDMIVRQDDYGLSVNKQVINFREKKAIVNWSRPLKTTNENVMGLESGKTYKIFLNWGIYTGPESSKLMQNEGQDIFYGANLADLKFVKDIKILKAKNEAYTLGMSLTMAVLTLMVYV